MQIEREVVQRRSAAVAESRDAAQGKQDAAAGSLLKPRCYRVIPSVSEESRSATDLRRAPRFLVPRNDTELASWTASAGGDRQHLLDDARPYGFPIRAGHHVWSQIADVTAQDRHPIADGKCLAQLVGDEHHRHALLAQAAQQFQQRGDLAGSEHGRRFVEQQHAATARQRLDDFHALPLAQRQVANLGSRRDIESEVGQHRREVLFGVGEIDHESALGAEGDIFEDGEIRHEGKVLIDRADAAPQRIGRGIEVDLLAGDADRPGIWLVHPGQDVHERRLAGAVFPEDGVDLPRPEIERDAVVGQDRAEALGDVAHLWGRWSSPLPSPIVMGEG